MPGGPSVVLGVAGGIAAYKACEVLRGLTEAGCDVTVVPTASALKFVGEATWAALSGKPIATTVWRGVHAVPHVRLGKSADLVLVVPATADLMARATHGLADDLLTNTLLTATCPIMMAPAMHTEMWQHPATQANVQSLRDRGVLVLDPAVGRLTGADSGAGRLPDPPAIVAAALDVLRRGEACAHDLAGQRIVVSTGGTRESWDPVRYIGNISSGRQGIALARTALSRGATVTLVVGAVDTDLPAGVRIVHVESAQQLASAMSTESASADIVVMAAAVADFRPVVAGEHKVKRSEAAQEISLDLVQNPDILAGLVNARGGATSPLIVGFAAETGDESHTPLEYGREKFERKGCDVLVVNDVSEGKVFGQADNEVVILARDGSETPVARADKATIADAIWDVVLRLTSPVGR
jgi:phosphopantothenoylcysteine decarboxylase/phosphopantothenate--cysteine ligase